MITSPLPRSRRSTTLIAAALLSLGACDVTAADTVSPASLATPSQRLQQRFTAAAEGWRKAMLKLPDAKPHEAELVRELRVVVAPTAIPLLRAHRRLDGHTVIVSAGWLALLDELLRAEAVSAGAAGGDKHCLSGYAGKLMDVFRENRERAAKVPPQPRHAWPRLTVLVESRAAPKGCTHLERADLQRLAVQAQVDKDADTAALWLLTRQAALLVALPVPPPMAATTAAAKAVAPAPAGDPTSGSRLKCGARAAQSSAAASAASIPASGATAVASNSGALSPDQRAQQALECYGLEQSRALAWLRANAADLFDEQTAQALSR